MCGLRKFVIAALLSAVLGFAQDEIPGKKVPSVTMSPSQVVTVTRGKPGTVDLRFRVPTGFHINSNKPNSEFLIATALKLNAPTDIVIGKITYPPGEQTSLSFAPDEKLSVYTGQFPLSVVVRPLATVVPGKYMVHGELKYQACDNAACYPPKKLPVEFEVKVIKGPPTQHKNPRQSPHIHS
jgi:Disulphide bond corrector protein DsbC